MASDLFLIAYSSVAFHYKKGALFFIFLIHMAAFRVEQFLIPVAFGWHSHFHHISDYRIHHIKNHDMSTCSIRHHSFSDMTRCDKNIQLKIHPAHCTLCSFLSHSRYQSTAHPFQKEDVDFFYLVWISKFP